ncbi:TIR domain-containing protein [Zymomonas mobilis]|uniref:toll/interleukin-1 receptor domain-containing protein n=1 Tax=Zymomonas mobilis TaxID=542 RepID=UPI00026D82C9|nr:toll/interleukin-1 receptor domain-containing protein [Zymomonas mobilis]AFN57614.1 hypothetical protein ZZ6_1763 [Zymomonas mobilis subsp. mobilis ATCC 29191]TQK75367.1 TIR domain-containing protein [Zymomonas mobilis]TQL14604.1 TIR domain-containing protein [Zymomonas mobilis]GEB88352.1 TIR domain-containing protein [Zymomonas mobilis subsp. mobilis]
MAQCTAPRNGHRTASARENCPACRSRYRGFDSFSPTTSFSGGGGSYHSPSRQKASWSKVSSSVLYTAAELLRFTPIHHAVAALSDLEDRRDVFLCHAWDDRDESAKELRGELELRGVSVWYSESNLPLLQEIKNGLSKSRVGVVLVTPALLKRLSAEYLADEELSALLASERLVSIIHNTTYEDLRSVSPLLASRRGLTTLKESMSDVAAKLDDLITV